MKIVFLILGILALLVFGGLAAGLGAKNSNQIEAIEKVESIGLGFFAGIGGTPPKSTYSTAMMMDFVGILIFLFAMVAIFLKKYALGLVAAGLTLVGGVFIWALQPDFGSGDENGKPIALIVMVAALIAALSIFMCKCQQEKQL